MVPSDRSQVHLPPVSAMRSLAPFGSLRGTPSRRARTGVGADIAPGASEGFGLWSFVSKLTLAIAAVALLPALEAGGFQAGTQNDVQALWLLTLLYCALPCALKLVAIALLATTHLPREDAA
mgnify:CR=1 FL=1